MSDIFNVSLIDESRSKKEGIFNFRKFNIFRYFHIISHSDIVHIHSGVYLLRFFHFFISKCLRKKTIVTVHSYKDHKRKIGKLLDKIVFRFADKVIFVNMEISHLFNLSNSLIKEAFIPPVDTESLPLSVEKWFDDKKKAGCLICSSNASRLEEYQGQDLYGLDLCIEAGRYFCNAGIKIAFFFVVGDKNGSINYEIYKNRISQYNLEDSFCLNTSLVPFIPVIQKSDIILRTTNTDGDALTIREGLYFGKPVIASDVVKRPEGTILFKTRDAASLIHAIQATSEDRKYQDNCSSKKALLPDYKMFYENIYRE